MTETVRRIGVMATRGRPDVVADAEGKVNDAAAAAGVEVVSPRRTGSTS